MKVFVTGATGFIGNAVARAFRQAGYRVQGLVRDAAKARSLAADEVAPIVGNMSDPSTYRAAAAECDVLVHCAFEYSASAYQRDRATIETLLAVARDGGHPRTVLYTSGVWVLGSTGEAVANDETPLDPLPLVVWRVEHERLVLAADGGHVRTLVMRPGCVYGYGGSLTGLWFASAAAGAVEVVGDGSNRWSMIHADDVGAAYVAAAQSDQAGRALNLGDGSRHRVGEMAAAAAQAAGVAGPIRHLSAEEAGARLGPLAQGLLADQQVDTSAVERAIGWEPRHRSFVAEIGTYHAAWQARQR